MMKDIRFLFGILGGFLGTFLGGIDGFIYTLFLFVCIDYITGLLFAFKLKYMSSETGFWGFVRKFLIFTLVGVAYTFDAYILYTGMALRTGVILFFISNEGLSVLENMAQLGVPIPDNMKDVLVQFRKDNESGGIE